MELINRLKPVVFTILVLVAAGSAAQETDENDALTPPVNQVVPVADDATIADEDAIFDDDYSVPELTDEELLMVEFERYKELMNDGVLDEADSVAKRVVELAIRTLGPRSDDTAKALTNLAIVQHRSGQYDAAQQNFQTAIDIIETNEDRLNEQLINPLKGLGAAQLEGGRPDLASDTFERAVHVTHVNEGPHNLEQVSILESLAEAHLRLGAADVAKQLQDTIYALSVRNIGDNIIDLLPALMRRAAWQHRAGFINDERATYRRVIRIIEDNFGKDDLQLVLPLTRLGQSFFFVDTSGSQSYQQSAITTGEIYFKRAVRIAENHPESNWETLAATTLSLGDYYMYEGNEQRAHKVYEEVWVLLSEEEQRLDFRRENLEELVALRSQPIRQYVGDLSGNSAALANSELLQGRITITYVISGRGRATNIKIVEAEPADFADMLHEVRREMRRRIYRPQFDESGPVESPEQVFTHQFYYRQEDLDAVRGEAATTEQSDQG